LETVKQTIQEYRSSKNPIIRVGISCLRRIYKSIQFVKRVCVDSDLRSIFLLQLLNSKNVHQTSSLTYMDRYPILFSACRDYFNGKQDLKILSYGCSTGEEVLTLRRYFPTAQIIGADINKQSLAKCRKLPVDEKINFVYSNIDEIKKYGPFDAIFCMAVLQRKPHEVASKKITSLKSVYPFEKFDNQVSELDKLMNTGGLLILHYTQYSLNDTNLATKYVALGNYNQDDYKSPMFDKQSNKVKNPSSQNSIHIKL
jgi:ubiquinone/menaquinone biosynthesis C-methylase UbiE